MSSSGPVACGEHCRVGGVLHGDLASCMTLHSGRCSGVGIAGVELLSWLLAEHDHLPAALSE
ncbi:hypothetical protein [Streptomyces sp. NPDC058695]|uniref:hypothetical protein n=1 Tax=Streptomyces sp. NPDC058695 TaxID=3346604 RepID=UPI003648790E